MKGKGVEVFSGFIALLMALMALATPDTVTVAAHQQDASWACGQPIVLRLAIAPGVPEQVVFDELAYPVDTLAGLGYDVRLGAGEPYRSDIDPTTIPGEVLVVVTDRPEQQRDLDGVKAGRTRLVTQGSDVLSAAVYIDAAGGALRGDVLLHELGHVLGLGHKEATVMGESWESPSTFDAAQLAAIDCR